MTTLAVMKARIASELRRTDLSAQIADAINTAVEVYRDEDFGFTESRSVTWNLVSGQDVYTQTDVPALERLIRIDYLALTDGANAYVVPRSVRVSWPDTGDLSQTGRPRSFFWYAQALRFWPIPDFTYPARLAGEYRVLAPASDAEANNPWMTKAERLIRARAKYELCVHVLREPDAMEMGARMLAEAEDARRQLYREVNRLAGTGRLLPMEF